MGRAKTSLQNLGQKVNGVRPEGKFIADVLQDMADDYLSGRNASLQPSGTDTSTNILAFTEDKGIWIGTDTGHWYYWNGTQYVDSGMAYMQSVIPNKMLMNLALRGILYIDENAKTMTITGDYIFSKFGYVAVNSVSIKTISYANLTTNTYYLYIRNNVLYFDTINTDCQTTDFILWIGYIVNATIRTSIYNCNNKKPNLALYCTNNFSIDETNHNFVIPSGYLFTSTLYYSITSQTISYSSFFNKSVALVFRNNTFILISLINAIFNDEDIICAIVWFNASGNILKKIYMVNQNENDILSLDSRVTTLENATTETLPKSSKILMRVGCIGDSYTSGWINDNTHKDNPNYSWCKYMKQLTGNEWTNFGESGSSTKSWIDGTLGKLSQVQAEGNKCQAYIIGLMINDQNSSATHYVALGTSADIGTDANSYYAYYYKLINACLTVNPDAFIFCNTCPKTGGNFSSYNQAVVDIVTYCQNENKNVYLVDLRNYNWNNTIFVNDALNGHYTAIGYEYMAEILNKALCDVINSNALDFQDVNLITYDEV